MHTSGKEEKERKGRVLIIQWGPVFRRGARKWSWHRDGGPGGTTSLNARSSIWESPGIGHGLHNWAKGNTTTNKSPGTIWTICIFSRTPEDMKTRCVIVITSFHCVTKAVLTHVVMYTDFFSWKPPTSALFIQMEDSPQNIHLPLFELYTTPEGGNI